MAYQRINITLPTETLQALDQHVAKGDRSQLIHAAIQAYLSQVQEKLLPQLKEGVIRRAERDRQLADDWFELEEEGRQQSGESLMVQVSEKTITLEAFLKRPETKPASEYIAGRIIQKPMLQGKHSKLQGKLVTAINQVVEDKRLALAFPELRCTFGGRSSFQILPFLPGIEFQLMIRVILPMFFQFAQIGRSRFCLQIKARPK